MILLSNLISLIFIFTPHIPPKSKIPTTSVTVFSHLGPQVIHNQRERSRRRQSNAANNLARHEKCHGNRNGWSDSNILQCSASVFECVSPPPPHEFVFSRQVGRRKTYSTRHNYFIPCLLITRLDIVNGFILCTSVWSEMELANPI